MLFSHADPDHVLGFRVFEQLRLNWFEVSEGRECHSPIEVMALPNVMNDLNAIHSKYGPYLDYYDSVRNLISRNEVPECKEMDGIKVTLIPVESATVFVFENSKYKAIYAPCDVKPFPQNPILSDADILIIGNTFVGEALKGGYVLQEGNFIREELFSMEEVLEIKAKFDIKMVVVTHLEEDWGKSYDDYRKLEQIYDNVYFAYDGMILDLEECD